MPGEAGERHRGPPDPGPRPRRHARARRGPETAGVMRGPRPLGWSDDDDVGGADAAVGLLRVVRHLLALGEDLESRAGDGGEVHEDVLAAFVGLDEAEPLGLVEPLDGAGSHCRSLPRSGPVLRDLDFSMAGWIDAALSPRRVTGR